MASDSCKSLLCVGLALMLASCSDSAGPSGEAAPQIGQIDTQRLLAADNTPGDWLTGGRDFGESHHSPLTAINKGNVADLGFAWDYDTGTHRGLEASPIVVDGVMFTSGTWGKVYALDAKTGAEIWKFDPKVDGQAGRYACCDVVNRGVAVWEGRIYVGAIDGRLFSLDAATGNVVWSADTFEDKSRAYAITGAPRVAGDVVVIGNAGAEYDARGYVTAYDLKTGEQRWRFFMVPGDPAKPFEHPEMEMASKTWDPNSRWDVGGGGTPYDGMAYDPELNLLYVGSGNAALYNRAERSPAGGDNLFLASILAINPDTGRLVWYYQTVPGEQWDFTATQPMILTEIEFKGETRKVLMQAPKNGFFYLLDRETGELLSADPFAKVTWAEKVDLETGRPVETEASNYNDGTTIMYPGMAGAHNWHPMAYSSQTGLVYIPAIEMGFYYLDETPDGHEHRPKGFNAGVLGLPGFMLPNFPPGALPGLPPIDELDPEFLDSHSVLRAFNPIDGSVAWEVRRGGWHQIAGVLSTDSGLVFQGNGSGVLDVFDAATGEQLHSIDTGTSIMAAPVTYRVDGEQYVAVMAGFGGAVKWQWYPPDTAAYQRGNSGRIVVFKLGGGAVPKPDLLPELEPIPEPPDSDATPEVVARGGALYGEHCGACHFNSGRSGAAHLYYMSEATHKAFDAIVRGGAYRPRGMPQFDDVLNEDDVAAIHAAIIAMARQAYDAQ